MIYMSGKTKSLFLTAIWIVAAFASTVSAENDASGAVKGPCPSGSAFCTKPQN